jgi:thymidylate synthase
MIHRYVIEKGSSLRAEYAELVDYVAGGEIQAPRGVKTNELTNFVLELESAESATFLNGIGRNASQDVLAAELMQWAAGVSDLSQLRAASKVFEQFSDDEHRLYGAYGPRAYEGLKRAVKVLSDDDSSRKATVSLWNNTEFIDSKDLPCTISWSFLIRHGALHMTTFMRSNDVWTGVTYDVPSMARIQSMMAWALGVDLGSYTHIAQSMHLYQSDWPALDHLHTPDLTSTDPPFFHEIDPLTRSNPVERWETMTTWCAEALAGRSSVKQFTPYAVRLKALGQNPHFCPICRYRLPQPELFCSSML